MQAFFDRSPDGRFENLRVVVATSPAGDIGTFEWDFVGTGPDGTLTRTAGCALLAFDGDAVKLKNAVRERRG